MSNNTTVTGIATATAIYAGLSVFAFVYAYTSISETMNGTMVLADNGLIDLDALTGDINSSEYLIKLLKHNCIAAIFLYIFALIYTVFRNEK